MYVGKRIKSILSVLLICGLLVVSVPCRAYAFGPVMVTPAVKYAIGAGIVAGGLYAANKDALNYAINDYWNKASDHVKSQWTNAVTYGTGIGIILLNDPLKSSIKDYLDTYYNTGEQTVEYEINDAPYQTEYDNHRLRINDVSLDVAFTGTQIIVYANGIEVSRGTQFRAREAGGPYHLELRLEDTGWVLRYWYLSSEIIWIGESRYGLNNTATGGINLPSWISQLENPDLWSSFVGSFGFVGDTAGFGNATEGRPDVKVPCPPVPAAEWPDNWIDDLQEEMNRTGNPTLDDETSIEEWEDEYEWYLDEFGNIYKVKKGQHPKKPDDEPLRIPGPPFPAPNVPKNYPTEDDPDLTIEHHPPQTTITENPDGSRTETTTQTTTTTKKWWDPSTRRWRTTTTDTTTTTTVDFAPDGTETGRTTTTTTQPKGEREEKAQPDDTAIDWEPLRRGLYELTEKFPFCLPWDLMRGIQSLESSQWDKKIRIEVGDGIWPAMVIDLTMFDGIASITRVVLLIIFDLGLIFGTRRLMGGDV